MRLEVLRAALDLPNLSPLFDILLGVYLVAVLAVVVISAGNRSSTWIVPAILSSWIVLPILFLVGSSSPATTPRIVIDFKNGAYAECAAYKDVGTDPRIWYVRYKQSGAENGVCVGACLSRIRGGHEMPDSCPEK